MKMEEFHNDNNYFFKQFWMRFVLLNL